MERLAQFSIRHRRIVFGIWIALFLAGGAAAGKVPDRLSLDFSLPGQPGTDACRSQPRDERHDKRRPISTAQEQRCRRIAPLNAH